MRPLTSLSQGHISASVVGSAPQTRIVREAEAVLARNRLGDVLFVSHGAVGDQDPSFAPSVDGAGASPMHSCTSAGTL
ncbi:hypothetical protein ABIA96_002655 [Bradyrhizobium sp. LB11.1]